MSVNADVIVNKALASGYVLTPVPDSLTVVEEDTNYYCFCEVADGSSLVWIHVLQDVYNNGFGVVGDWVVDDPGVLYNQAVDEGSFDMMRMQELADEALNVYKTVFVRLVNEGVKVVDV